MNIEQLRAQIAALQDATMDENGNFRSGYDEGKFDALSAVDALLDSLQEEPASENLEKEISRCILDEDMNFDSCARHFANWQKEQFEKNRLAACDRQTEEEAEIERDFVTSIIEKEHRQPTFDDAIKYGMRLKEEEIKEALLSEVLPCFMHGGEADEVVAKLDEVLNFQKK